MRKKPSIIITLLQCVGETAKSLLLVGEDVFVSPENFLSLRKALTHYSAQQQANAINYFKRTYCKRVRTRDKEMYLVTSWAKIRLMKAIIEKKRENMQGKWDGEWLVVTFDIAELTRTQRNFLRRQLYVLGFTNLQKSVWISPANIRAELLMLLKLWNMEMQKGDVRVLVVRELIEDKDLKRKFGL